ncbi:MAG: outer membrane protein assembly factor BamA, partial [Smithellaceae bacterium]|nr:outer membrane protein assembly factor BamA [Smithellaceae bacterium]
TGELRKSRFLSLLDRERLLPLIRGRQITESLAADVIQRTGGDFAIMGSITEIGGAVSIDLKIIDAQKPTAPDSSFFYGKLTEDLRPLLRQMQDLILVKLEAGHKIALIEIKGNRKIESPAIIQVLQSAPGSLYSEDRIAADVKAIFRLGYFSDVAVRVADTPQGRVVTFEVEEKPLITDIVISGNKALKRADIEEVMTIKLRQSLNREKVKEDVEKIRDLYNRKGYLNARITDSVKIEGDRDIKVLIEVVEGAKLYVRRISFSGNVVYSDKILKDVMSLKEKGIFSFFTDSGILNNEELKQDIQKINAFYLNSGFINAQIGEPEITHDDEGIYLNISIVEGKQFKVGKVAITGDTLKAARETLLKDLRLTERPYYDRGAVIRDLDYLTQACSDEGYAYADVSPRTQVDEENLKVDINYHIQKGRQVFVNRINILGNTKTRDKVIRRQVALEEGELFSSSKMKTSFTNLNRLRYFEEVDFQTERGPAENLTDLNIHVKEKPTGMFSVGAGYSAVDYAVFTAQVSQQNLFGRGQILSLKANIGATVTMYDISFIEPWLFDIPLWSKFDAWDSSRNYDTYHLKTQGTGVSFGYPLWKYVSGYVGYRYTLNDINEVKDTAASYIKSQEGKTIASSVSLGLTRDTTDDNIFPTRGSKNSVGMDYTGGILGGDTDFIRYQATSAWFFPLPLNTTFGIRGRLGYLEAIGGKEVPIYERFFLGGMSSLRGLRSIGPVDPLTQDVIGGLTMLNANAEYLFPLLKDAGMKGLFFYDTGNAWLSGYRVDDLRHTAGVGIRWYSPIGPLRLEWGHVLDRKEGESPSRWEFTIGMFM